MARSKRLIPDALAQEIVNGITNVSRLMRTVDLPQGMTPERVGILALIRDHGPISLTELANLAKVRAPTMSRMVTSLEEDGLARKQRAKTDGRGIVIALTSKGRRRFEGANRKSLQHLKQALGKLSSSEVAALTSLARVMASFRSSNGQTE